MNLCAQKVGFQGVIKDLSGDPFLVTRLLELGFAKGRLLELYAIAPFGAPWVVRVRGGMVALRRDEAACIDV